MFLIIISLVFTKFHVFIISNHIFKLNNLLFAVLNELFYFFKLENLFQFITYWPIIFKIIMSASCLIAPYFSIYALLDRNSYTSKDEYTY